MLVKRLQVAQSHGSEVKLVDGGDASYEAGTEGALWLLLPKLQTRARRVDAYK